MVKMMSVHEGKYPSLTEWLRTEFVLLPDKLAVWTPFLDFAELSSEEGRTAVMWDTDPMIRVKNLPGKNGLFRKKNPDRIELATAVASRFELDHQTEEAKRFVEAKILHEMVHWGDHKDGVDQPGEEGEEFEIEAYGGVIPRYWETDGVAPERSVHTTKTSDPRGVRNNNPGNVRIGDRWQGLAKPEEMAVFQRDERHFCVFKAPQWGIRAMARILIAYQDRHNLLTVSKMIHRWAPPEDDNPTRKYIRSVATAMNIDKDTNFDIADYTRCRPMVTVMIKMENGVQPYSAETIDKGLLLAGVEPVGI